MADIQEITVGNQTFEFPASMSEDEMQRLINLELQKPNTNQASETQNNLVPTGLNTQINNTVDQTQNMLWGHWYCYRRCRCCYSRKYRTTGFYS